MFFVLIPVDSQVYLQWQNPPVQLHCFTLVAALFVKQPQHF